MVRSWIDTMRFNWRAMTESVRRLALAVSWIGKLHFRYFHVRHQLQSKLGRKWLDQNLPSASNKKLLNAYKEVLSIAIQPSHRVEVAKRALRLRQILAALRSIPSYDCSIDTAAGRRVLEAALARCLSAICRQEVSPTMFESVTLQAGLVRSLVQWLERTGLQQRELCNSLPANFGWQSVVDSHAESRTTKSQLSQQKLEQLEGSFHIAEQELRFVIAEQNMQFLAMPTALCDAQKASGNTTEATGGPRAATRPKLPQTRTCTD